MADRASSRLACLFGMKIILLQIIVTMKKPMKTLEKTQEKDVYIVKDVLSKKAKLSSVQILKDFMGRINYSLS